VRRDRTVLALVGWLALSLPLLALFALSVPALHARKLDPPTEVRVGLDELGLPVTAYATWWSAVLLAFAAVCAGVAALVVARRPREPAAWSTALLLVALGAANAPSMEALVWQRPALAPVATAAFQLLLVSLLLFLFTFPDGRFVPRWSWPAVVVAAAGLVVARGSVATPVGEALFWALLLGLGGGLAAQVHRYRRVSPPEQREQTRWVLVAAAVAVALQLVLPVLEGVPALSRPGAGAALLDMASPAGISLGFSLVALALAGALLRSRLWGLDVVVNRALVYAAVTAGLLVLYVALVTVLSRWAGAVGQAGGSVLGAALVALAFAPLRARVQRLVDRSMYGLRDQPYAVLSALGQRLEATVAPSAVLQTVVDSTRTALRSPYVALAVHRDGVLRVAAESGRTAEVGVALPLVHRHQPVGELRVAPRSPSESFGPADRALLDDLGRSAAAAVHAVELTEELQRSRQRLVTAREEERRRLRRDLHDGLGPALASMTLQAETACELVDERPEVAVDILRDLVVQLQSSTADIRRLVYDLRPPALDDLGLAEALRRALARSSSSALRLELELPSPVPAMSAAAEVAVYRIVQEAVVNVLRHAAATTCTVTLSEDDGAVLVDVRDDGVGLPAGLCEGVGLRSMRERAAELGGSCAVTTRPGGGTDVRVRLPRSAPVGVPG
jgi:signal transduction histidine kinase